MFRAKLVGLAAIGAFYAWLAYAAGHPRIDAEYDAHFLHRAASCWVPRAIRADDPRPSDIRYADLSYPEACRSLRRGWWDPEGWGVWSFGDRATLHLAWPQGADAVELTLRGPPEGNPAIPARLELAGDVTQVDVPPGRTSTVTLKLPPAGEQSAADLHLSFGHYAVMPMVRRQQGDPIMRHIGIGLIAARFLPERSVAPAETP